MDELDYRRATVVSYCLLAFTMGMMLLHTHMVEERNREVLNRISVSVTDIGIAVHRDKPPVEVNSTTYITGMYMPAQGVLWADIDQTPAALMSTVLHEYGHYVYWDVMSRQERAGWNLISNQSTEFVSDYARTDAKEDFAETFMAGITCTYSTEGLPEAKAAYIQEFAVTKLRKKDALQ